MASRNASTSPSRAATGTRRPGASRTPIGVESLEGRQLLSAGGGGLAAVADPTPLRLVSADFVFAGAGRAGKPAGITLTFNEAIDPATAQAGTFRLATRRLGPNGSLVSRPIRVLDVSYDQEAHSVTITPDRRAFFPREARVAVLPGVADLAGNALASKAVVIVRRDLPAR